jgi:hypothetical protein
MPLGEVIIGFFEEILGYIIFDLIFEGIGKLFREIYYSLRKLITGKEREIPELKLIENRYLLKKVMIMYNFHKLVSKGTLGTVTEVIDEQTLNIEFEDSNGRPIVINDKQAFKIKRSNVKLIKKSRTKPD